jgi:DNA invertase Pin-like site-specific DNA recombinase
MSWSSEGSIDSHGRASGRRSRIFSSSGAHGVGFRPYVEPYLNTENELVSHILLAVMSYFAEYEAKTISRRTKAGLKRAREKGKQIGRPSKFDESKDELEAMLEQDLSTAEMKRPAGLACNTVKKYLRRIEEVPDFQ